MMKRVLATLTALLLLLSACSVATMEGAGKELEDTVANAVDVDNKYVKMVKGGYRSDNPSITYEEAFSAFFGTPRWRYFKGEDDQDVVEFTGDCIYREASVKARIQFIVDEENMTFEATYLAFNEVPQDALTLAAVIATVFEEAAGAQDASQGSEATKPSSPVTSMEEAQRLVDNWLLDHPMGGMAGAAAEDEAYTPDAVRAAYFVLELWEAPRQFAGLVYVRKSDGCLLHTSFHGDQLGDLDQWYAETYGAGSANSVGELLFHDSPAFAWLDLPIDPIMDAWGTPKLFTEGWGVNFCEYDGIHFEFDADRIIYNISMTSAACTYNGRSLAGSRSELIGLLGTPTREGWGVRYHYDTSLEEDMYYMLYDGFYEGHSLQVELPYQEGTADAVTLW